MTISHIAVDPERSPAKAVPAGLLQALPVLPGESAVEWHNHRAGVVKSLAAVGTVEIALAERVAYCLWRLRRLAAYETATLALGLDESAAESNGDGVIVAKIRGTVLQIPLPSGVRLDNDPVRQRLEATEGKLQEKRRTIALWERLLPVLNGAPGISPSTPLDGSDVAAVLQGLAGYMPPGLDPEAPDFLKEVNVPDEASDKPWNWKGWTVAMLRKAIAAIAKSSADATVLARWVTDRERALASDREELARLEQEAQELRERWCHQRLLPEAATREGLSQYEAHVARQLEVALERLESLQSVRAG
jgi:hypothetical protein